MERDSETGGEGQGLAGAAQNALGAVRARAGEIAETARGKAGNLQATAADRLESGAESLREREADDAFGRLGSQVATGLQGTADWLRETDLTNFAEFQARLEQEAREHPMRTLLATLGVGYLLGKAMR